jgi:hypothetical protein
MALTKRYPLMCSKSNKQDTLTGLGNWSQCSTTCSLPADFPKDAAEAHTVRNGAESGANPIREVTFKLECFWRATLRKLKVFNSSDIEQFIRDGYVVLHEAFPSSVAAAAREILWKELQLSPTDRSGWTKSVVHMQKNFSEPPFTDAFTERLYAAYDDIVGEGRYQRHKALGWWPVSFPGFDAPPWSVPEGGWHVDGIQFHHHIYSRDQGLLPIFILSDIGPGDGGTAIDAGSHVRTARILAAAEPAGLSIGELSKKVNEFKPERPIEMTGRAGDVVLLHPFILHARSNNTGNSVRFICNPCVTLKEHMNLKRENIDAYSPVELAIINALQGVTS